MLRRFHYPERTGVYTLANVVPLLKQAKSRVQHHGITCTKFQAGISNGECVITVHCTFLKCLLSVSFDCTSATPG